MHKPIAIALFVLMVAAQWWVPADMITGSERVLQKGKAWRFRCAPVDPNDPFRGRYIVLRFEANQIAADQNQFYEGQPVYVRFTEDTLGFAQLHSIKPKPQTSPAQDELETWVDYVYNHETDSGQQVTIQLPFTRLYMDEFDAPEAEKIYGNALSDTNARVYALVHIYHGQAKLRDVMVNDKSLKSMLQP